MTHDRRNAPNECDDKLRLKLKRQRIPIDACKSTRCRFGCGFDDSRDIKLLEKRKRIRIVIAGNVTSGICCIRSKCYETLRHLARFQFGTHRP